MRLRFPFLLAALLGLAAAAGRAREAAEPADLAGLREKLARPDRPLTWVITGDSITQGAKWLGPERAYPELIQERIRWELKRKRDIVINSGLSGEKSAGLLADFEWRVLRFRPDVVAIMIGMNDAVAGPAGRERFAADLREMIGRVRAAGAVPILQRTNPVGPSDPGAQTRDDLPAYNALIADVARATGTLLVDHWRHWLDAAPEERRRWLADPIHPNAAGHRQLAREFFRALGCLDPAAPSCQP